MPPLRFKMITLSIVFGTMLGGILIPNGTSQCSGLRGVSSSLLLIFVCAPAAAETLNKGLLKPVCLYEGRTALLLYDVCEWDFTSQ